MRKSDEITKYKVFAVIDTNVIVSYASYPNRDSSIADVGRLIEKGNIIPLYDERMLSEYFTVLNYAKFNLTDDSIKNSINMLLNKGIFIKDVKELDVVFKDNTDIPFYEVMMSTSEIDSQLVTGNEKHFPDGCYVTPKLLVDTMHNIETRFISFIDTDKYDKEFNELIIKLISSEKYFLGNKLPKQFLKDITARRLSEREHIKLDNYIK